MTQYPSASTLSHVKRLILRDTQLFMLLSGRIAIRGNCGELLHLSVLRWVDRL